MNWESWVESFVPDEMRPVIAARIPKNSDIREENKRGGGLLVII